MIIGSTWLIVTKLDVLDELAEIPVCIGYKISGKKISEIPADAAGFEKIEPTYETLPGWKQSTVGITDFEKLPARARQYLEFLEGASGGARIAMVSTGPEREQTIFMPDFAHEILAREKKAGRQAS